MPFDDAWLRRDGLLGGRVQVDTLIKEGKYSSIYRMRDQRDQRSWILRVHVGSQDAKDMAEMQQGFQHAWSILSQLDDPRLPRLLDGVSLDGCTLLLREEVAGRSLLSFIQSGGVIEESLVRDWGGQLCDLLGVLHHAGIVLGVVRPNDVYVQDDGSLRLADYGALLFHPAGKRQRLIKDWLGGMAPPEALRGEALGVSSDVYAIGSLLHYCLTRVKPRTHSSPFTLLGKHRDDLSRDFNRVVMRCLSFSPDGRFDDLRSLKVALLGQAGPMGSPQADVAAKLSAAPPQLLFRDVDPRQPPIQSLTIHSAGPDDRITLRSNTPWLRIAPEAIEGEVGTFSVSVDPAQLSVGPPVLGELHVYGKRGNMKVPVEASVRATGLARRSVLAIGLLQIGLPALVGSLTLGFLAGVHAETRSVMAILHPGPEDTLLLRYLMNGFIVWLTLQPLLLPVVSFLVFSKVNRLQRTRIWPVYLLSLAWPLALMGVILSTTGDWLPLPGHVWLQAWGVAWLGSVGLFTEFGWTHHLPSLLGRGAAWSVRLALIAATVISLLGIFR